MINDGEMARCRGVPHHLPPVRKRSHAACRSQPSDQPSSLSSRGTLTRRRSVSDTTTSHSRLGRHEQRRSKRRAFACSTRPGHPRPRPFTAATARLGSRSRWACGVHRPVLPGRRRATTRSTRRTRRNRRMCSSQRRSGRSTSDTRGSAIARHGTPTTIARRRAHRDMEASPTSDRPTGPHGIGGIRT